MSANSYSPAAEPSSNERLLAALCYPIFLIISLYILLTEEHKNKAFERYHAIQSLAAGLVVWVLFAILSTILGSTLIGLVCVPILLIAAIAPLLYWAYQSYQGKLFEIPMVTKFMRDQKWL